MEQNVIQTNGGIATNGNMSVKNHHGCKKDYIWNPATCSCQNEKYSLSIMDDSVFTCDEVIQWVMQWRNQNYSNKL